MSEEYLLLLKSQNTSPSFQRLIQEKIGSQEVFLTTICQFSKLPVNIPVRHTPINYIHCVFELEYWLEHYSLMYKKVDPTGFACPGCRKFANFKDYGVDYTFYHILQGLELFKNNNPDIKLQLLLFNFIINTSQLIYNRIAHICLTFILLSDNKKFIFQQFQCINKVVKPIMLNNKQPRKDFNCQVQIQYWEQLKDNRDLIKSQLNQKMLQSQKKLVKHQ